MSQPVVIVGGGLAGLTAATVLQQEGQPFLILEASDQVGGKVRTDEIAGFRVDRGFQVYFTAYPTASKYLDYAALDLRPFLAGSMVYDGVRLEEIRQDNWFISALSPLMNTLDKVKLLQWNQRVNAMSWDDIWRMPDTTTDAHLEKLGFSRTMIERFARPFFGGIFLDRSLQVSVRAFATVWKNLLLGDTVLPAQGMQAIPSQLASRLPQDSIRTGSGVQSLRTNRNQIQGVTLTSGEEINAEKVILAADAASIAGLAGLEPPQYKASTTLTFDAPESPVEQPILVLNGSDRGIVNEVAPISRVAPATAPAGSQLISVTLLGLHAEDDLKLAQKVVKELRAWFPDTSLHRWMLIRVDRIAHAQLDQPVGFRERRWSQTPGPEGLVIASEATEMSGIDGAMLSGEKAAHLVLGAH